MLSGRRTTLTVATRSAVLNALDREVYDGLVNLHPIGRLGKPEDVAERAVGGEGVRERVRAPVDVGERQRHVGTSVPVPDSLNRLSERVIGCAIAVHRELGSRGAVLVCGGLGGIMEAACRGAKEAGGTTVGKKVHS